jgi:hypothetical protein
MPDQVVHAEMPSPQLSVLPTWNNAYPLDGRDANDVSVSVEKWRPDMAAPFQLAKEVPIVAGVPGEKLPPGPL